MDIRSTSLPGVLRVVPAPRFDERGFFVRVLSAPEFEAAGIDVTAFVQENQSRSRRGTLRGLHVRAGGGEAKTIRCARGEIFIVVVDVRPRSSCFTKSEVFRLDDQRHEQLYLPPGCANGYQALSDWADVCYRHSRPYDPAEDRAIAWDDPELGVPWPLADPIMSERDRTAPPLAGLRSELEGWFGGLTPDDVPDDRLTAG